MIQDVRNRIIIIAGVAIGLILALVLFIVGIKDRSAPVVKEDKKVPASEAAKEQKLTKPPSKPNVPAENPEDTNLRQVARLFVERFGSYSNQNDNTHLSDVLPLSTKRMQKYIESQAIDFGREYEGSTTVVVVSKITEKMTAKATVELGVQQLLQTAAASKTEYRTGLVTFIKEDGAWKVDGLYWRL